MFGAADGGVQFNVPTVCDLTEQSINNALQNIVSQLNDKVAPITKNFDEDGNEKRPDCSKGVKNEIACEAVDNWEAADVSGSLGTTPSTIGITHSGDKFIHIRRNASPNPDITELRVYSIVDEVVGSVEVSGSWTELTNTGSFSLRVAVSPDDKYVAFQQFAGSGGTHFIIADLASGALVGSVASTLAGVDESQPVWHGDFVYWPEQTTGDVLVYDVSTLASPTETTFNTSLTAATDCVASGTALYVCGTGGVVGIDISNAPTLVEDSVEAGAADYISMDLDNGVLFQVERLTPTQLQFATFDVSGTTVTLNTNGTISESTTIFGGVSVIFSGGYAIAWSQGLVGVSGAYTAIVFDVTDPTSVSVVETITYSPGVAGNIGPAITRTGLRSISTYNFQTSSQVTHPGEGSPVRVCEIQVDRLKFNGALACADLPLLYGVPTNSPKWENVDVDKLDGLDSTAFALASHTHDAGDVVSGVFADARVSESSVTQHQGAIDHGSIAGLSDDDHTQYALLAGRSGGQTIIGGTGSGESLTLNSTSHTTKGDVVLAAGLLTADETSGAVTIGGDVEVSEGSISFDGETNESITGTVAADSAALRPSILFRKARGSLASEAAAQSGDQLGAFFWFGHDGSGYSGAPAAMECRAAENFSSTTKGTRLIFGTTPIGAATRAQVCTYLPSANIRIGTGSTSPTAGDKAVIMEQGTALSGLPSNTGAIQVKDVSGTAEVFAVDEAGTATQLSPHAFELFEPDPAEEFPWSYSSEQPYLGVRTEVDLAKLARLVEQLTGEKLIYRTDIPRRDWASDQETQMRKHMREYEEWEKEEWDEVAPTVPVVKSPPVWLRRRLEEKRLLDSRRQQALRAELATWKKERNVA